MTRLSSAHIWARKHVWGLGMIVGLLVVSNLAVKQFKRPGQMNVIEAQAMDMTVMKPPVGSVPVATEFVARRAFSSKVRYTGSVAPYDEQNIYPRVEGWLTGLTVYSGDRVRAGQLLATLDSPDIQNKLSEATYGHIAATREIPVAQANLSRMRAEKNAANREIQAAQRDVDAARARLNAAERMVSQAQKELKSARASLNYWNVEFKRQATLLKEGAVSQQEYDLEEAQLIAAEAEVENKEAKVEEAKANVEAARAELSNKKIGVQVAQDRAGAAEAALRAASGEVEMKAASANMAGAAKATAATFNQYRRITVPFDGVVTKRYISPGVLVNPGMAILNVAQIDRVRLQANVAEQDLAYIKPGAEIVARTLKGASRTYRAYVTSIAPVTDQTSRTATVEAIVDNKDHFLVPGDFISMEIATSSSIDTVAVPTSALTQKDGRDAIWVTEYVKPEGKMTYYCTMHPEVTSDKPGLCPKCNMKLEPKQVGEGKKARLVNVTIGKTDGDRTEILSGLNEGDEIIYKGHTYLREGDYVTPTEWDANGPKQLPPPPGGGKMLDMPGHGGHSGQSRSAPSQSVDEHAGHDMSGGESHQMKTAPSSGSSVKSKQQKKETAKPAKQYTCPMHPDFVTDNPNALCPECNMKLVPKTGSSGSNSKSSRQEPAKKSAVKQYTCPMHPDFVTDDPNALCPECNMKLEPKKG